MSVILFVLLNVLAFKSAYFFTKLIYKNELIDWKKAVLSWATLWVLTVLVTMKLPGLFGWLNLTNVFLVNLVLVLGSGFAVWRDKKGFLLNFKRPEVTEKKLLIGLMFFLPFLVVFAARYHNALLQVPLDYDSLAFHLPMMLEWVKTGNIWDVFYSAFAAPLGFYPSNGELFALWFFLPFRDDVAVNLMNFPLFFLVGVSVYSLARRIGISSMFSFLVTGMLIWLPINFRQTGSTMVDMLFTFGFVVALYFLIELWQERKLSDFLLCGAGLGIFFGTKYLGLPYSVLPAVLVIGYVLWHSYKKSFKRPITALSLFFAGMISGGGIWYIRNWVVSGNPLFPVDVNLLGYKVFSGYPGVSDSVFSLALFDNVRNLATLQEFVGDFVKMAGFQSLLMAVATFALGVIFLRGLFQKKIDWWAGILLVSQAYYFFLYWKAPFSYVHLHSNVRYAYMSLVLGAIAYGYVAEKFKDARNWLFVMGATFIWPSILFLLLLPSKDVVLNDRFVLNLDLFFSHSGLSLKVLVLVSLMIFTVVAVLKDFWDKNYFQRSAGLLLITTVLAVVLLPTIKQAQTDLKEVFYEEWFDSEFTHTTQLRAISEVSKWLDENDRDANIAYAGFVLPYLLLGDDLQRDVTYVNINDCFECEHAEYADLEDRIRNNPNYEAWLANLEQADKGYVTVIPHETPGVFSYEYDWATRHPEKFELVFEASINRMYLFKIKD